ncbi:conserved hypothetical protein [Ricinus communis]|uniref:Uncharacterized protein n=1 Tax=Ricinus communis TaxID=3988 RepID=B9SMQ6_RICCO|nr:conserved hypothetical protein [Ricinus communis]
MKNEEEEERIIPSPNCYKRRVRLTGTGVSEEVAILETEVKGKQILLRLET